MKLMLPFMEGRFFVCHSLYRFLNWLENHTNREGRIIIEDSESDTFHQYYKAHLPALFPEYVKHEYLCSPRPMYPSYTSFTSGVLFEKKIGDYTFEELNYSPELKISQSLQSISGIRG